MTVALVLHGRVGLWAASASRMSGSAAAGVHSTQSHHAAHPCAHTSIIHVSDGSLARRSLIAH